MSRWTNLKLFFVVIILLNLSACSLFKQEERAVRIGINPWPGYEFLYIANELDEFSKHDLKVRLIEFSSLADSRRALETDQVDIIGSTVIDQVYLNQKTDLDAVSFYVVDASTGGDILLAQQPITQLKQLKNKKVGIEPASLGIYEAYLALSHVGLSLADIEAVPVYQNEVAESFLQKKVDAVITFPPNSLQIMKKEPRANIIWSTRENPNKVVDVLLTSKAYAEKNRSNLITVANIFEKMRQRILAGDAMGLAMMAEHQRLSPSELTSIFANEIKVLSKEEQIPFFKAPSKLKEIYFEVESSLIEYKEFSKKKPATVIFDILDEKGN